VERTSALPDVVAMQTRQANLEGTGEILLRRLVKEALRMRPARLIVGEVRQEECLDLVKASTNGIRGIAARPGRPSWALAGEWRVGREPAHTAE
jgi:Flp pilus assembly CpaF family ATPase